MNELERALFEDIRPVEYILRTGNTSCRICGAFFQELWVYEPGKGPCGTNFVSRGEFQNCECQE